MTKISYLIFQNNNIVDVKEFLKLLSLINSQNGVGLIYSENSNRKATIYYASNGFRADIRLTSKDIVKNPNRYKIPKNKILLVCEIADIVTINIIRELIYTLDYKIFSVELKSYLPRDPSLYDCTVGIENHKDLALLRNLNYKPLFWFWNSYSYYAKNLSDKKIHFINGYMLKHMVEKNKSNPSNDFSYVVANDIEEFVRYFDQKLIPVDYYRFLNKDFKIINYSYIDIDGLKGNYYIKSKVFKYKKAENSYYSIDQASNTAVKQGEKFEEVVNSIIRSSIKTTKSFERVFISKDLEFEEVNKHDLMPKIEANIYIK